MNCKQSQKWIALSVGSDLPDAEEKALQIHLRSCPECRERSHRLRRSLDHLKAPLEVGQDNLHDSIWPSLSSKIANKKVSRSERQLSYLLPTAAVLSASVALMLMWRNPLPLHQPGGAERSMARRQVVSPPPPISNASVSSPFQVDFLRSPRMPFQGRYESAMLPPQLSDPMGQWSPLSKPPVDGLLGNSDDGLSSGLPLKVHPEHFAGSVEGVPLTVEDPEKRALDVDPMHFSD